MTNMPTPPKPQRQAPVLGGDGEKKKKKKKNRKNGEAGDPTKKKPNSVANVKDIDLKLRSCGYISNLKEGDTVKEKLDKIMVVHKWYSRFLATFRSEDIAELAKSDGATGVAFEAVGVVAALDALNKRIKRYVSEAESHITKLDSGATALTRMTLFDDRNQKVLPEPGAPRAPGARMPVPENLQNYIEAQFFGGRLRFGYVNLKAAMTLNMNMLREKAASTGFRKLEDVSPVFLCLELDNESNLLYAHFGELGSSILAITVQFEIDTSGDLKKLEHMRFDVFRAKNLLNMVTIVRYKDFNTMQKLLNYNSRGRAYSARRRL